MKSILEAALSTVDYALSLVNKADAFAHEQIARLTALRERILKQIAALDGGLMSAVPDHADCPTYAALPTQAKAAVDSTMDTINGV